MLSGVQTFFAQTQIKCHPLCNCSQCSGFNLLLSKDDSRLWSPLSLASFLGQPLILEFFTSQKDTMEKIIEDSDKQGRTCLHLAAWNGHQNGVLLLLNAKANFNARDNAGNSPLHYSAGHGHLSCTKALLYSAEHQSYPLGNLTLCLCQVLK